MELKSKKSVSVLLTTAMLLIVLILINGCEKSEPGTSESATTEMSQDMAEHEHEAMTSADETMAQVAAATEQTTCPIMDGNKINKDIFVEYQGKKVYFCCAGCEKVFKEDPEKYIAKLPQFQK
jgi:YHS domain-containing protein